MTLTRQMKLRESYRVRAEDALPVGTRVRLQNDHAGCGFSLTTHMGRHDGDKATVTERTFFLDGSELFLYELLFEDGCEFYAAPWEVEHQ